ncbi:mating-type protein MAT1-2, partial [Lentinula edodes]
RIPRPPNSWILFRADMLRDPDFRAQYPNAHQHVISKALSVLWRNASKEVKEEYERRAEGAKLKHMILHPDYVYRPQ